MQREDASSDILLSRSSKGLFIFIKGARRPGEVDGHGVAEAIPAANPDRGAGHTEAMAGTCDPGLSHPLRRRRPFGRHQKAIWDHITARASLCSQYRDAVHDQSLQVHLVRWPRALSPKPISQTFR